jgi:hypothetical protein
LIDRLKHVKLYEEHKKKKPSMPDPAPIRQVFNIVAIGQKGRLQYEAILLAASLRLTNPDFPGRLLVAEPQSGPKWRGNPEMDAPARALLTEMGAEIVPFESNAFGVEYPYGNKIEALTALPDEPFLFLDTDTLILSDFSAVRFDFTRPSASMRREGTWPQIELYGPGYAAIWKSLYDRFGLDFATSLDLGQPDEYWQRYMYFNAGWFFGASAPAFGKRFLDTACTIRDRTPTQVVIQELYPWLDQIALPLVIHALGGGRPGAALAGLDGDVTCHYRLLPLLYARESDAVVAALEAAAGRPDLRPILRDYEPVKMMIYQNKGRKARALFDRANLPRREQAIGKVLKAEGLWLR